MSRLSVVVTQPISGSRWEGKVYPESCGKDLKEKLEEELKIPALCQQLFVEDKELDNVDRLPGSGGELQATLVVTIEPALKELDGVDQFKKIAALEALAMVPRSCDDVVLARLIDDTVPRPQRCLFHSNRTVQARTLEIILQVAHKSDAAVVTALLSAIVSGFYPPLVDALENLIADEDKAALLAEKARFTDFSNDVRLSAVQALTLGDSGASPFLNQAATRALDMEQVRRNEPGACKGGGKGA